MTEPRQVSGAVPRWIVAKCVSLGVDLVPTTDADDDGLLLGQVREEALLQQVGPKLADEATFEGFKAGGDGCYTTNAWAASWFPNKRGILLTGGTGVGKTHLAVAAGRTIAARGNVVTFIWVPGYLERLRRTMGDDTEAESATQIARRADVVILDELGLDATPTDWQRRQVYLLVDALWRGGTTAIGTSNLTPEELGAFEQYGERTVSRLVDMMARVHLDGDDYRVARARGAR